MRGKALIVSTVQATIGQFNIDNIKALQSLGYEVHIACNLDDQSAWDTSHIEEFKKLMIKEGVICHNIDFDRSISNVNSIIKAYTQIKTLLRNNDYTIIHTHTPIASAIVRYAAKRESLSLIYTAHGFHFYKGAPLINWIVFYPIEKVLSRYTTVLITINKEDYYRAKKKFHTKAIYYVPGVGVDFDKFRFDSTIRRIKRKELNLTEKDIMVLSVGELNANKNHGTIVKALGKVELPNLHYYIAGKGYLDDELLEIADKNSVDLHLLGHRKDISDLLSSADLYILPSIREGLNVSLIEAIASGVYCLVSDIRGNCDLINNSADRINARDVDAWADRISEIFSTGHPKRNCFDDALFQNLKTSSICKKMLEIYASC